jgi:hypothetical protein
MKGMAVFEKTGLIYKKKYSSYHNSDYENGTVLCCRFV